MKTYLLTLRNLTYLVIFAVVFCSGCEKKPSPKTGAETTQTTTTAKIEKAEPLAPVETKTQMVEPKPSTEAAKQPTESTSKTSGKTAVEPNVPIDNIAATVNGFNITKSQVEARIKPQLDQMAAQGSKVPPQFIEQYKTQLMQQALDGMVIEHLLDEEVKSNKIMVSDEEAIEHLTKIASQQQPPLSLDDLKQLMEARGQSFDEVKQYIGHGLAYKKLIETQFAGKVNVTEDDVKKYYAENTAQFKTPEQIRASHILIRPDITDPNTDPNQAKAKAKAKTQELLEQVKNGADFAALAKANSGCPSAEKGGDLGFFEKGKMVPAFEEAAFALKVGQVSDIVETTYGYHIIKITDHKDASDIPFEQAKDDIIKTLTQQKQAKLANDYIESLRAKANITYPSTKGSNIEEPFIEGMNIEDINTDEPPSNK